MSARPARALFQATPDLTDAPEGSFRYGSAYFAEKGLTPKLWDLVEKMAVGIEDPRVTYRYELLPAGHVFGHGRFHGDGTQNPGEIHRLLTFGGEPTEGENGVLLFGGTVWEYGGDYQHRALPARVSSHRLMLRVSQTLVACRNFWSPPRHG